ncbi:DNA recombination protein RmuC [Marinobacterium jannaschii]|uniref:DNA recombination protein RmuC n=1 Tax=Marinobacterium jannaschii TaxID=64970 RepID=UPI0004890300|nr:DNA recombination protein RmuC [Marinobacterium jannaschii]
MTEELSGVVIAVALLALVFNVLQWRARQRISRALADSDQLNRLQAQRVEQLEADLTAEKAQLQQLGLQLQQQEQSLQTLQIRHARYEERVMQLERYEDRTAELEAEQQELQQQLADRSRQAAELETLLNAERRNHQEKLDTLNEARQQLKTEFQNLANQILEEKAARFTQANQENMGQLLDPLKTQLGEFKRRVDDVYDKETRDRQALSEQINHLKQLNQQMSQDAINLTNALKGETKTQGNWGEMVLERVLEESGLRKGHEFELEVSLQNDNKRYRPDAIVRLPDEKDVIVDSKVSLVAYEQYCTSEDAQQKAQHLRAHIQSLQGHIKGLSEKAYQSLEGVRSLDFVLMFVPVEGAFLLAMEKDQNLFRFAFERNIILVSPSTLLIALRTIHNIWRYEYQSRNAQEIARRGGELHDKFVGFVAALEEVGKHLDRGQEAYSTAYKRLASGRGNLVSQAIQLNNLGADSKKKLPSTLTELSRETDLLE